MKKTRIFVDMDGVLAEWKGCSEFKELFEEGYFIDLLPQDWVIEGIKNVIESMNDLVEVFVLSSVLPTKYAIPEKAAWLDKYINLPEENRIWVPNGDNKADHVPGGIQPTDILIDDYSLNLHRWVNSGGIGIKVLNGVNWKNKTWKGPVIPQLSTQVDFYNIVKYYIS